MTCNDGQLDENAVAEMVNPAEEANKQQAVDFEDKWKRALAELDNMRKRSEREFENLRKYSSEPLILDVIRSVEDIERAIGETKTRKKEVIRGLELILKDLKATLEKNGVAVIRSVGQEFDPKVHEAVMQACTDCLDNDNKVVEELQRGYMLHDKVIRFAKVKVAKYEDAKDIPDKGGD